MIDIEIYSSCTSAVIIGVQVRVYAGSTVRNEQVKYGQGVRLI